MKVRFSDRSPNWLAVLAIVVIVVGVAAALNLTRLPFVNNTRTYHAYFASTGGMTASDEVAIDGVKVGLIKHMSLAGPKVEVTFTVNDNVFIGSQTTASARVQTPLGTEYMELTPAGTTRLNRPIPLTGTQVPYTLIGDLYQLTNQVQAYNIPNLVKALQTSSATFSGTPAGEVASALTGLAKFSEVLANNHDQLAAIITQGSQLSAVLSQRSSELVNLVGQGNLILQVLQQRQAAIKELLTGTTALSAQLTTLLGSNQSQFQNLFNNLDSVSSVLSKDSGDISQAIPILAAFSRYAANSTGSGAFADVSIPTLLIPDDVIAQCGQAGSFPSGSSNTVVGCRPK
jgi:phospholipid/cholesterol/gamma-HCH transport system substrate-binding protein